MKSNYEHLSPQQNCPYCGHLFTRTGGDEQRPQEGDLSICIACLGVLEFGPGLLLVKADLTRLGFDELAEIRLLQCALTKAKGRHGH